jgi:hypothetical protein
VKSSPIDLTGCRRDGSFDIEAERIALFNRVTAELSRGQCIGQQCRNFTVFQCVKSRCKERSSSTGSKYQLNETWLNIQLEPLEAFDDGISKGLEEGKTESDYCNAVARMCMSRDEIDMFTGKL